MRGRGGREGEKGREGGREREGKGGREIYDKPAAQQQSMAVLS